MQPTRVILPAAALLLLAACARDASAQSTPGYLPLFDKDMVSVGLQFGPSRPTATNGFKDIVGGGIDFDLQSFYYPWDWIAVGAQLGYVTFGSKQWEAQSDFGPVQLESQAKAVSFSLLSRLNLLQERSWTPYIVGGIGRHSLSISANVLTPGIIYRDTGGASRTWSSKGIVVTGGGGVEFFVIRGLSLSGEVRFRQFRNGDTVESLSYLIGFTTWFNYK